MAAKSGGETADQQQVCGYCLQPRNLKEVELQCCNCAKWFKKKCLEIEVGPVVKFLVNYQFLCKKCGPNKQETFVKKQASFYHLCLTALANLTHDEQKSYFSKDKDIIPFIEKNWEAMTCAPRRTKNSWHTTVSRTMTRDDVFLNKLSTENSNEQFYALKESQLEKIGPINENIKLVRSGDPLNSLSNNETDEVSSSNGSSSNSSSNSRRGYKRKVVSDFANGANYGSGSNGSGGAYGSSSLTTSLGSHQGGGGTRKRGAVNDLSRLEKMVPHLFPSDHPFNKDGYRYHLVEPDPHSPMKQKFEETELWAGKPLPGHLYRLFLESKVALTLHDRAPQLKLSDDRMSVTGEKGYSMVRATHGVLKGGWYFEATVKEAPGAKSNTNSTSSTSAALRIGWAQPLANLQAPCGYDKFSYSWRSRKGTVFHDSHGKTYSKKLKENNDDNKNDDGDGSYGPGDVLGFYIYLKPEEEDEEETDKVGKDDKEEKNKKTKGHLNLPDSCKQMTLVKFKQHLYYEEKDNFATSEKQLKASKGSRICFFKNGVCHGEAFSDIYRGVYYPAVSLYKQAACTLNFGPHFKYPINGLDSKYADTKPVSDLAFEKFVSHTLADITYHVEHDGRYE